MKHHRFNRAWGLLLAVVMAILLIVPASALAKSSAAAKSAFAGTKKDGRAAAQALLRDTGAASLSLALLSGNKVVWEQSFGYADKATFTPPTAMTMYGIGSVSKIPATVAAMILADRGQIDLDAPVYKYIPSFRMHGDDYRQVTVRMLLDHSSGFPGSDYANTMTYSYLPTYVDQVLGTLASSTLKTTPGYMSVYCNDGFTLIEKLVQNVTGKTYAQFCQDEIFTPLGMTTSKYPLTPFADGTYAKCYTMSATGAANRQEVVNTLASGGLYSTPTDMAKFGAMLMSYGTYGGHRVLSKAAVTQMGKDQTLRQYNPVPSDFCRYGLGWDSVTQGGLKAVGVTGWMKGGDSADYHAALIVAPKAKLTVVALGVAPLNSGLLETFAERIALHAMVDTGQMRRMPTPLAQKPPKMKNATASQLAAMTGVWATQGAILRIAAQTPGGQTLNMYQLENGTWSSAPLHVMHMRKNGRFYEKGTIKNWHVLKAGDRTYLVGNTPGGYGHYTYSYIIAQKLRPQDTLSAAWQARVGKVWLLTNDAFDSMTWNGAATMAMKVDQIPDLSGYVTTNTSTYGLEVNDPSRSDTIAGMFLQIPGFGSRDLNDLQVDSLGAEEWVKFGHSVYRPMAGVPTLAAGANAVTIGPEGYVEWRKLPNAGSVTITGASGWYLYDGDLEPGSSGSTSPATVNAPIAGCYVALFGAPGTTITVTAP